ncbi:MAG: HD domain protein [Lentisphaerae bacterium ADurb.BinA184]|nr:MAG: HD domain protein [Lentisphaerae bacterium ADurb.BinA184]
MKSWRADHIPRKAVCVPGVPPVDIADFLPVIDHPLFQKLRGRRQLGINYLVFPGAVHTRFEHTIGVLGLTQRLCRLYGLGDDDRRALCGYALLHDIGHGPFSHQIEPVLNGDHHGRSLLCLQRMEREIGQCGLSVATLADYVCGRNGLHRLVSDRNLGTDKLDYLYRDALHIGFSGLPDIPTVTLYAVMDARGWAVDEKFVEDVKRIQKFYGYLHQHGYLNKTALSVQRVFQRAVQEALAGGRADAERLWEMDDGELFGWLRGSRSRLARGLLARFDDRSFHRTAYVIKPRGYGFAERAANKSLVVREWSQRELKRFSDRFADSAKLLALEDELAHALRVAPGEVLFAAMPYFAKLVPQDIRIRSQSGDGEYLLFAKDKDHHRSLVGDYLRTFAIRVIAAPEVRDAVSAQAGLIGEFLREHLPSDRPRRAL